MSFRKPRSDAKLLNLPEEQQAQLAEWLLGTMPYHVAQKRVEAEFGVRVGLAAFSSFYAEVCAPLRLSQRSRAAQMAQEIATEAGKSPGAFDQATVDAIRQKAFELSINPAADPGDVKALFMLLQKSRDQDLKAQQIDLARRRVELLESKLKAVQDAVTSAKAGGLTPDTLRRIEEAAKIL